MIEGTLVVWND